MFGRPVLLPASRQADSPFAFEEISPATSVITWVQVNGRSAEMHLPETTGAGCAFFDYDNDCWMDIYVVNSGRCDFFSPNPPLRNAARRQNSIALENQPVTTQP